MAHQPDKIPWTLLTSKLEYVSSDPTRKGAACLRPLFDDLSELDEFVRAFAKQIENDSVQERRKFPSRFEPPGPDEMVLSDAVVRRIGGTVRRYQLENRHGIACWGYDAQSKSVELEPCYHRHACKCVIGYEERTAKYISLSSEEDRAFEFLEKNEEPFWQMELLKTLVLLDEMEPILRTAEMPEPDFWSSEILKPFKRCFRSYGGHFRGQEIYCLAILSYICLNVLYCYPQLWDPSNGAQTASQGDYRSLECYQWMLVRCTMEGDFSVVARYLHRDFFGISNGIFSSSWWSQYHYRPYGCVSIEQILASEKPGGYVPTRSDVNEVRSIFQRRGLPTELIREVLSIAKYTVQDPLHPENLKELKSYLTQCWQILVRCDMMAIDDGSPINWEAKVRHCIWILYCEWDRKMPADP